MAKLHLVLAIALSAGCGGMTGDDGGGSGDRPPLMPGVSTLAGWSDPGYLDGSRQTNLFNNPTNLVYGPDGKLYVADFDNGKIRALDMAGNATTVIAKTELSRPFGLVFVGDTLYVGTDRDPQGNGGTDDLMSGSIWKVDIAAKTATPVAARIGRPRGLAALSDGRIAIADYEHHVIEILDPASGLVSPLAGSWDSKGFADGVGASAQFAVPYALAQRSDGKLLVTDWGNNRLRLVGLDGSVTTVAGDSLNHPQGLVQTQNGDVYITDQDNYRVCKVTADLARVTAIAGDGTPGYNDSEDKAAAKFYGLEGISATPDGSMIFVADGTRGENVEFNRVRVINN